MNDTHLCNVESPQQFLPESLFFPPTEVSSPFVSFSTVSQDRDSEHLLAQISTEDEVDEYRLTDFFGS